MKAEYKESVPLTAAMLPVNPEYGPVTKCSRHTYNRKSFYIVADEYNNWHSASLDLATFVPLPDGFLTSDKVAQILGLKGGAK